MDAMKRRNPSERVSAQEALVIFKDIRTKGIAVLSEISAELGKVATAEGATDAKKPFVSAAQDLQAGDVSLHSASSSISTVDNVDLAHLVEHGIYRGDRSKTRRRTEGHLQWSLEGHR